MANLRKELKKYLSTQELGDRLTKLNRNKSDFEKTQEETSDFRRYQRYGSVNTSQSTGSFTVGETNKRMCIYCKKQHWSDECNEYPNLQSRKSKAKSFCFICLRKGHLLKECNSTRACVYCKKKGNHHKGLCASQFSTQQKEMSNASLETRETNLVASEECVIMQTAMIDLENGKDEENGIKQSVRVLLDSGSERTYISKDITNKLKLTPIDENFLTIYTFGRTKPKCIEIPVVEMIMILKSGFTMRIKANVVPNVAGTIERTPFRSEAIKQTLEQYELADMIPMKKEYCNIDLPVGNNYYADIMSTKRTMLSDGLYLFESKFGWILSGRTKNEYTPPKRDSLTMLTYSSSEIPTKFLGFSKTDDSIFSD